MAKTNPLICARFMKAKNTVYSGIQKVSSVVMILTLLWLTVSAPFVFFSQQELAKQQCLVSAQLPDSNADEDSTNPFGNTTEEKSTGSTSFSEEFLHDHHEDSHFSIVISSFHKTENASLYVAFHGELLVPPPNMG